MSGLLWNFVRAAVGIFTEAAPYLLLGFILAGFVHVFLPGRRVARSLGQCGWRGVFWASVIGIPLPLCSCSVIPVATALRRRGATKGATASFLISTPETGLDSISASYALLDPVMTVFRPLAAFVSAMVGGLIVDWIEHVPILGALRKAGRQPNGRYACPIHVENSQPDFDFTAACCAGDGGNELRRSWHWRVLSFGCRDVMRDVVWSLLAGFLVSGVITVLLPEDFFARNFGGEFAAIAVMLGVGMPLYVCATASTPVAAAMIAKGLSPGAALVFLLAGPATNLATMLVVRRQLGWRSLAAYLGSIAGVAVIAGLALNGVYHAWFGGHWQMRLQAAGGEFLPAWVSWPCSALLGMLLLWAAAGKLRERWRKPPRGTDKCACEQP